MIESFDYFAGAWQEPLGADASAGARAIHLRDSQITKSQADTIDTQIAD